jgi:cell division transport system permease protein
MISFIRIIRYGAQGFKRNIWLSVIAIITMTLTLTTVTVFALGDLVASKQYQEFNKKIDYVIFLKDAASDGDVDGFYTQLKLRSEVKASTYYDKTQVLSRFQENVKNIEALKGVVSSDNNPLPREVDVKFNDPKQIDTFDNFVRQTKYVQIVEATSYQTNKGAIDNYLKATNLLRLFGLFFTGFFVLIAFLVILNTIRLAIFSRREEIEVMRLVGATTAYVRGPFLVEGILFGLIGALISAILFWGILHQVQLVLQDSLRTGTTNYLSDIFSSSLGGIISIPGFNSLFGQLLLLQLGAGVLLGTLCSYIAARRYLRE